MLEAWHIIKWVWAAVFLIYSVVQVLAFRRLKGNRKRRSGLVATIMVVLMGLEGAIRSIFFFENRTAGRIGALVVGVAATIATIVLISMFGVSPAAEEESEDDARHRVQSLKLS